LKYEKLTTRLTNKTWTKPEIKIHIKNPEYMYLKFSALLTPSVNKTVKLHGFKEVCKPRNIYMYHLVNVDHNGIATHPTRSDCEGF